MATLTDDQFLLEVDNLISGRPTELKVEAPPAKVDPPIETPAVEAPVVETPAIEQPAIEPAEKVEAPAEVVETPEKIEEQKAAEIPAKTPEEIAAAAASAEAAKEPDYKAIYTQLFGKPIRAAGQDITLANVDEVISLVQKGAGFHSKMNRVQKDLKYVEMLRNNDLLDETKLSLLIDAQAGKPGAIKKLLDSAKIDPLALDSAEASTYAPSDHRISDEQLNFQNVVQDLSVSDSGQAIIQEARSWDQASKAEVYKTPDVLSFLSKQKEMGRYDLIKAQVEKEKILGNVPLNESFLASYSRVGQQMMQAGAFGKTETPTPTPVAQKVITPAVPANAKQAAAAAPTKRSSAAVVEVPAAKAGNDEEFLKNFKQVLKI